MTKCKAHESQYGEITWDSTKSPTCPVCDAENEIQLQSKALIYMTRRMEERRRPPILDSITKDSAAKENQEEMEGARDIRKG